MWLYDEPGNVAIKSPGGFHVTIIWRLPCSHNICFVICPQVTSQGSYLVAIKSGHSYFSCSLKIIVILRCLNLEMHFAIFAIHLSRLHSRKFTNDGHLRVTRLFRCNFNWRLVTKQNHNGFKILPPNNGHLKVVIR